jgi:hypothetical protein
VITLLTDTLTATRPVRAVALPAPCWWIDRNDCWEITHHTTREQAEADHVERVSHDISHDEDSVLSVALSVAAAFAIEPGVARREPRRCYEVTCPECGSGQHVQERYERCLDDGCDYEFEIEQIALDDPDQSRLFEVLPTHDLAGHPISRVVVFADEDPR